MGSPLTLQHPPRLQLLVTLILILFLSLRTAVVVVESKCKRAPVIFNFGDSNSDTGGLQAGLGFVRGLPYGRLFPDGPTGRVCDGRLVIDFLCESVKANYLSSYLEALGSDFTGGANFAVSGSSTLPRNVPFALFIQVLQFQRFKSRSLQLIAKAGSKHLVNEEGFRNALYTFDIGQNDIYLAFNATPNYSQVIEKIPSVLAEIKGAIKTIYDSGGRKFWVHGTGPLGCLPLMVSIFNTTFSNVDAWGCLTSFNDASKAFNVALSGLCDELRTELKNTTIVYTDLYAIKYDIIIANHTKYGFESPLKVCTTCVPVVGGFPICHACPEGTRDISWDGVHYTEAANAIVSSNILSVKYSKPRVKFEKLFM